MKKFFNHILVDISTDPFLKEKQTNKKVVTYNSVNEHKMWLFVSW